MQADASILDKLRRASQQYNCKKKQLATRVDSWYNMTQSDSQTYPSTQGCTAIYSTQSTRTRIPSSQWESVPQPDVKLSQATSSTRPSLVSVTLAFDAYCQTEAFKSLGLSRVHAATSPRKSNRAVVEVIKPPTIITSPLSLVAQTQTNQGIHQQTDPKLFECISSITDNLSSGFRDVLGAVASIAAAAKPRDSDPEDDELVYLSFLFEHDSTELLDAPVILKETSTIKCAEQKPTTRKRTRKPVSIALGPVKEDDDVLPPTIKTVPNSGLKRARICV
jgi:hypothetical protein